MIVITGAAGFIGSALLGYFNAVYPEKHVVIVDNFSNASKRKNYNQKNYISCVERGTFFGFLEESHGKVEYIFHIGARTDTAETDKMLFDRMNLEYSKKIWNACTLYKIPLIYASSAATYGNGEFGYSDDHQLIPSLKPLNAYGESKNDFDNWVLKQKSTPPFWTGLKFFNVYGPNEYHKGRMASVIFHAFNQIRIDKKMRLFRSHKSKIKDGHQLRDFIYVKDVLEAINYLYQNSTKTASGIYNLGTGLARTFNDLTKAVFDAMGMETNIEYIDIPADIRDNYQYYTCANMAKLRSQGFKLKMHTLEEGVRDYVQNYLFEKCYL